MVIIMQLKLLCLALSFFAIALYCQRVWIWWTRRFGMGQAIKDYGPAAHIEKTGTPSMGGIVALALLPFLAAVSYLSGATDIWDAPSLWAYPVMAALVGLTDDLLKFFRKSSEGLKSIQKLFLQMAVTIPWAVWVSGDGVYLMPSMSVARPYGIVLLLFLGVGILNAVNVTDGLDGLAGGAMTVSLSAVLLLVDIAAVKVSAVFGLAALAAFLWHNSNPAELFMGDVGAHLWGALLISICVESKFLLFIFPLSFLFGVEMLTVAVQILAIRKFGRKVFRMSPLHHHFELCGWKEQKIVTRFCIAHLVGMAALFIFVFSIYGGGGIEWQSVKIFPR
jgi:phospho-N-acetylmuramoyl-pentapeptide-transferase